MMRSARMLRISLIISRYMLARCPRRPSPLALGCCGLCDAACPCTAAAWLAGDISGLLLLQQQLRGNEVDEREAHEDEHVEPQIAKTERLVEGADADRLEPGRGKRQADEPPLP